MAPWWVPPSGKWVFFQSGDKIRKAPDGELLHYERPGADGESGSVWRAPSVGGEETRVLDSVWKSNWAVVGKGIYFIVLRAPDDRVVFADQTVGVGH